MLRNDVEPQNFTHRCLNVTQKNIIEATMKFLIDDLVEILNPFEFKVVLRAVCTLEVDERILQWIADKGLFNQFMFLVEIMAHPCPQNRNVGHPDIARLIYEHSLEGTSRETADISQINDGVINKIVYYSTGRGLVGQEPQGIFGLTSRNDNTAQPVSREAVYTYIKFLFEAAITEYSDKKIVTADAQQSCLNPSLVISKSQWLISLCIDKNNKYGILIEGVNPNGLHFLECHAAITNASDKSITLKIQNFSTKNSFYVPWLRQIFKTTNTQGEILKKLIRDDVNRSLTATEYSTQTTWKFFSHDKDSYNKKWAVEKLNQINLKFTNTNKVQVIPYREMLDSYKPRFR